VSIITEFNTDKHTNDYRIGYFPLGHNVRPVGELHIDRNTAHRQQAFWKHRSNSLVSPGGHSASVRPRLGYSDDLGFSRVLQAVFGIDLTIQRKSDKENHWAYLPALSRSDYQQRDRLGPDSMACVGRVCV
jgi:hypothetical protein